MSKWLLSGESCKSGSNVDQSDDKEDERRGEILLRSAANLIQKCLQMIQWTAKVCTTAVNMEMEKDISSLNINQGINYSNHCLWYG